MQHCGPGGPGQRRSNPPVVAMSATGASSVPLGGRGRRPRIARTRDSQTGGAEFSGFCIPSNSISDRFLRDAWRFSGIRMKQSILLLHSSRSLDASARASRSRGCRAVRAASWFDLRAGALHHGVPECAVLPIEDRNVEVLALGRSQTGSGARSLALFAKSGKHP